MNSALRNLIVTAFFCASAAYANSSASCSKIQKTCNALQVKYASAVKSWEQIHFDTVPEDITIAEDHWYSCLKTKKESGCYKK